MAKVKTKVAAKKRRPYRVMVAFNETGDAAYMGELSRHGSVTSAVIRAYKWGRRTNRRVSVWRGTRRLVTLFGA